MDKTRNKIRCPPARRSASGAETPKEALDFFRWKRAPLLNSWDIRLFPFYVRNIFYIFGLRNGCHSNNFINYIRRLISAYVLILGLGLILSLFYVLYFFSLIACFCVYFFSFVPNMVLYLYVKQLQTVCVSNRNRH